MQLNEEGLHPLAHAARAGESAPTPWGRKAWKSFLDTYQDVENAIFYVEDNPVKDGRNRQKWEFVVPFDGMGMRC